MNPCTCSVSRAWTSTVTSSSTAWVCSAGSEGRSTTGSATKLLVPSGLSVYDKRKLELIAQQGVAIDVIRGHVGTA